MTDDLTWALRELTHVQDELAATPEDDFANRQRLREREKELRSRLRAFNETWTDHLSIDQIERRIAVLEARIEAHYGNRLSHTAGAQTGMGGGLDPTVLHQMNRAMDKSNDIAGMKAELTRLEDKLRSMRGDGG